MKQRTLSIRGIFGVLLALLLVVTSQTAMAQWWRFGRDSGVPYISELLFNDISALRVERSLQMSPEDLRQKRVTVRGRAEVGQGKIGRVEASMDNGVTWTPIPFNDRGLFSFEFTPELERVYPFRIRSLSTTGQVSDEAENAFEFKLVREDSRALAREAFQTLLQRYMTRDRSGFMQLVSNQFAGNGTALDAALSNDFRFFDSIRIEPTIRQMAASNNRWIIHFNFNRQVRSIKSGQMLQDRGQSAVTLVREGDGYKLYELAAPLIFGVSDPGDVATYVAEGAAGSQVLVVDADGNASLGSQQRSSTSPKGAAGAAREIRLQPGQGMSLPMGNIVPCSWRETNCALMFEGPNMFFAGDEATGMMVASGSDLDAIRPPLSGQMMSHATVRVGTVYGVQMQDGSTLVFKLVSRSGDAVNIQYRHYR